MTTPTTGGCLWCGVPHTLVPGTGTTLVVGPHKCNTHSDSCPGAEAPPFSGNPVVDDLRRTALVQAHDARVSVLVHREQIVALVSEGSGHSLVVDKLGALIETEVLASRWTALAQHTTVLTLVLEAVEFLTQPYAATGSVDAYVDERFRSGTRMWLREIRDSVSGSVLGDLLDKI